MDILKLDFGGNFMKAIVAKILKKAIRNNIGLDVDILLDKMTFTVKDGLANIHAELDAELTADELMKFVKSRDLI